MWIEELRESFCPIPFSLLPRGRGPLGQPVGSLWISLACLTILPYGAFLAFYLVVHLSGFSFLSDFLPET